jgi:trk system potassium uptake protein
MKLINPLFIIRILSTVLLIETLTFLLCLPAAFIYGEQTSPFLFSAGVSLLMSGIFYIVSRGADKEKFSNRDGFLSVTISWVLFSLIGTLPYLFSNTIPSFIDAFFESTSGFSTTGSTILKNVEILPFSILFWRSLTQWIGGIGIIVMLIIILPSMKITGYQLFSLESSFWEKIHPKTKAIVYRILFIYLGLTVAEIILLAVGDMNLFESVCHSFGTVATGGFSTKNSSLVYFSAYSQYIVMIFMLMAGTSQVIYYYIVKLNFRKVKHNEEIWFYVGIILMAGSLTTIILLLNSNKPLETAFREGFFQVISFISCTGYLSANFNLWPIAAVLILFLLMFAGGSTGSSSGGIKMGRHIIVLKNIRNAFTKLNHPNSISFIKFNDKALGENTNISILSFVVLYLFIFVIGTFVVVATGLEPVYAASSVASSMAGIGPAVGSSGAPNCFATVPEVTKLILSLLMILGRLEIITVFAIFTRTFWKL